MPLKRTPPRSGISSPDVTEQTAFFARSIPQSDSTPNLTSIETDNNSGRFKRKRDDDSVSMEEIHKLISTSNAKSDARFAALQSSVAEIIAQNDEIKSSVEFISKQYDDMMVHIQQLESERKADRSHIQQLEEKVDNLERMLYLTKIEIRNIIKKQDENKDDLCNIVAGIGNLLQAPIDRTDIKDVFRAGKGKGDGEKSTIVVDLLSVTKKEDILRKLRLFNKKDKENKLKTTHLKIESPPKPVYISEKLPPKAQRIYYLARGFAKENKFKYCWTSLGRVFLRENDGKQQFLIKTEDDLNKLLEKK